MTRRALLAYLTAALADRERLIWEPGRKLISIPHERLDYYSTFCPNHAGRVALLADGWVRRAGLGDFVKRTTPREALHQCRRVYAAVYRIPSANG